MKYPYYITLLFILILFINCKSLTTDFIQKGGGNEAIHNAVIDFSNSTKLYKNDSIFSISIYDSIDDFFRVTIIKNNMKLLVKQGIKIELNGELPSRYIEKDGKLFFWWDNNYPITEDAIKVFQKYDFLQSDDNGIIQFPDFSIDDGQNAAVYFFCKNNLCKYKRIITADIRYHNYRPKLECN